MTIPIFSADEENRIIEMAWEDRTPFEAIYFQFSIRENVVVEIMRKQSSSIQTSMRRTPT